MRKREVRKYGDTWVIKLNPSDVTDLGWKEGTIVDVDTIQKVFVIIKNKKEVTKNE